MTAACRRLIVVAFAAIVLPACHSDGRWRDDTPFPPAPGAADYDIYTVVLREVVSDLPSRSLVISTMTRGHRIQGEEIPEEDATDRLLAAAWPRVKWDTLASFRTLNRTSAPLDDRILTPRPINFVNVWRWAEYESVWTLSRVGFDPEGRQAVVYVAEHARRHHHRPLSREDRHKRQDSTKERGHYYLLERDGDYWRIIAVYAPPSEWNDPHAPER